MTINPLIALGVESPDYSKGIEQLGNAIKQKKQDERQKRLDELAIENLNYERERQGRMDALALEDRAYNRKRDGISDSRESRRLALAEQGFATEQELKKLQIANEKIENMSAREKARYDSLILGAAGLNTFLESGDMKGAEQFLTARRMDLGQRIAAGEEVDTRETDEALAMIKSGDQEQIKQLLGTTQNLVKLGQLRGTLEAGGSEGFTLSENQTRFDQFGNIIASGPAKENDPPSGYRVAADGNLEPIPGGPAEVKAKAEEEAYKKSVERTQMKAKVITEKVDEALDYLDKKSGGPLNPDPTGFGGGVTKVLPGSDAFNLNKMIETVQANLGFEELQAMREASPTGGALGSVAVRELEFLQATLASLDVGQDRDILEKNLRAVKRHYKNWSDAVEKAQGQSGSPDDSVIDFNDLPE